MFNDLTPRQKAFVLEYSKIKNATKAAIAAGYSAKTAYVQGSRLMENPKIKAAVEQLDQRKVADLRVRFVDESREAFNDVLNLIKQLKQELSDKPDVRKQRLLFDALNSIMDRAGYKAPDKLQADIKQQTHIFEDMSKEELIEFIKRPTIQEVIREEEDGEVKH